ncbi:MAG: hypothetical protein IT267_06955 [Saprospiraceae bacterium]|nr:hypothetical protein [Saprospiraceae bacterium]
MDKIIIAYRVSDITLARYCAAMDVNFLVINLDDRSHEDNNQLIEQILEWTEGPQIILCSNDDEKLFFYSQQKNYKVLNTRIFYSDSPQNRTELGLFFSSTYGMSWNDNQLKICKIDDRTTVQNLEDAFVYLIQMEKEFKTGVYDFEWLDKVFEKIASMKN